MPCGADTMKSEVDEGIQSDGGRGWGRGTREDGGSWKSIAEVTFEEKGRFPLLRGMPGKEEWLMNRRLWSGRLQERRWWRLRLRCACPRCELVAYQSYCRRLDLEKVTHLVASNIPEPSKEGKNRGGEELPKKDTFP